MNTQIKVGLGFALGFAVALLGNPFAGGAVILGALAYDGYLSKRDDEVRVKAEYVETKIKDIYEILSSLQASQAHLDRLSIAVSELTQDKAVETHRRGLGL